MKRKLLIIGASGHGKVVVDIAMRMKKWQYIAFLDDNKNIRNSMGVEVIGTLSEVSNYIDEYEIFVAIGNNPIRQKIYEILQKLGASIPILVHPNAIIGSQVKIGCGTVVMAGVVVNSNTQIGKSCIINTVSSIDHDNCIGDFVHISPGTHLGGTVKIGKGSWLGIGSVIINNVNITEWCKVGAGSVVINDITEPGVYVGNPVRKLN